MNFVKYLRASFLFSFIATVGSLYFSEFLHLPPCLLCWYQRIAMYPLVIIFGVGLWQEDRGAARYAMPFIVMGTLIAAYHNLLYYGFISETLAPCKLGVSCTAKQISIAGFISIPLLSLGGFLALAAFTLIFQRSQKDSHV